MVYIIETYAHSNKDLSKKISISNIIQYHTSPFISDSNDFYFYYLPLCFKLCI